MKDILNKVMNKNYLILILLLTAHFSFAQVGIGVYPTGTAAGIGIKYSLTGKVCGELRFTNFTFVAESLNSTATSELMLHYRIQFLEKVRFHIGIGARMEWNSKLKEKYGASIPIGVEGFPFAAIPNLALFFETAPYFTSDFDKANLGGLRTTSGVCYYFTKKNKTEIKK